MKRTLIALAAGLLVLPLVVGAVWGQGYRPTRVTLAGGVAWLSSPGQELVTLVDGRSELVLGSIRALAGSKVDRVVQVGSSALLVDNTAGTVTRLDGATYDLSRPVRFATSGPLTVLAGSSAVYVIDGNGKASVADPLDLTVRGETQLRAAPGPGQAVVDAEGRLWTVAGGELVGFGPVGGAMRSGGAGGTAQLVIAQGRPAVADPAEHRAGWVDGGGTVARWSCFPAEPAAGLQVLGSTKAPLLFAGVPGAGQLVVADLGSGACGSALPVGKPGDVLGPLVESAPFVLVPNVTTGRVAVIDTVGGTIAADLQVLPDPMGKLELVARDGLVFYNDLAGDRAGVLRFDSGTWKVGPVARKFTLGADGKAEPSNQILEPGSGAIPFDRPPQNLPESRVLTAPRTGLTVPGSSTSARSSPVTTTPSATPTTTTKTLPPPTVTTPDVSFAVQKQLSAVRGQIESSIRTACGDQTLCLHLTTRIVSPGQTLVAVPPCTISAVPPAGQVVDRGSSFTVSINEPCGGGPGPITTTTTPPQVFCTPPCGGPQPVTTAQTAGPAALPRSS